MRAGEQGTSEHGPGAAYRGENLGYDGAGDFYLGERKLGPFVAAIGCFVRDRLELV